MKNYIKGRILACFGFITCLFGFFSLGNQVNFETIPTIIFAILFGLISIVFVLTFKESFDKTAWGDINGRN